VINGGNKMYSFKNDYSEGAHPKILNALLETNLEQDEGYGLDRYSKKAIERIKEKIGSEKADIHFISGGTQTNLHWWNKEWVSDW
jgi:threonine aldolase